MNEPIMRVGVSTMASDRRMKLADVEGQTNYLIPRVPTTFDKAFPEIEEIRVEVRPQGEGFEPHRGENDRVDTYVNGGIPSIINCRNPRCYGGGLNLAYLIRWSIVEARRTEFEHRYTCEGYEGSPKGRKNYGPCDTQFRVKVTVKYKDVKQQ
jgi:hypothetical protein